MITHLQACDILQWQYDNITGYFDHDIYLNGDRCSIKYFDDCTVVANEGSHDLLNWFNNARFFMVQIPGLGGVDEGFNAGTEEITEEASKLIPKDKLVILIGHSRGAPRSMIIGARLLKIGYNIKIITFASPRPGDSIFGALIYPYIEASYRNYHSFDDQDFVCDAPLPHPFGYKHPIEAKIIDIPPPPNDNWGFLARHHLFLYREGIKNG